MTPRNRLTVAVALVVGLTLMMSMAAFAVGQDGSEGVAQAISTSTVSSTSSSSAPTTIEAPTTTSTTEAPPATEPSVPETTVPAVEVPTTLAPLPTVPATFPPTVAAPAAPQPTTPVTLPAPPPFPEIQALTPQEAYERAAALKAAEQQRQAMAEPPPADPEPEPAPGEEPAPTDDPLQELSIADQQFFQCVRWRESRNDYTAVNRWSGAGGAYQILPSTWNNTVAHFGLWHLYGTPPQYASVHDQDLVAVRLLQWYGRSPWAGPGC